MVDAVWVAVLTYAHILAAVGWLGATLTINITLLPLMPKFAPSTRGDLLRHFGPRFGLFNLLFAGLTVVFGAALYIVIAPGMSPNWHTTLDIGIAVALVAFVLGLTVTLPAIRRLSRMVPAPDAPPGPPPQGFTSTLRMMQLGSVAGLALLLVTLGFMVAAAQL